MLSSPMLFLLCEERKVLVHLLISSFSPNFKFCVFFISLSLNSTEVYQTTQSSQLSLMSKTFLGLLVVLGIVWTCILGVSCLPALGLVFFPLFCVIFWWKTTESTVELDEMIIAFSRSFSSYAVVASFSHLVFVFTLSSLFSKYFIRSSFFFSINSSDGLFKFLHS